MLGTSRRWLCLCSSGARQAQRPGKLSGLRQAARNAKPGEASAVTVESWPRGAGVTAPAAARQGHAGSGLVTAAWREPKLALAGHTRAARVLDNAGKGCGGIAPCAWSTVSYMVSSSRFGGGWELGPRRAHSRLGGGRLAAVHSDGHRGPKTPSSSWPWLSDHLPRSNRRICIVAGGGYGSARSGEGMRSLGKFSRGLEGPGVDPDPRMPRGSTRRPGRAGHRS